jgi:alpha-L-arabinofuranosidase
VEGTNLETRYQWKNSVGPVENRPINKTRWSYTFPHRMFPDYYQSYGLGFYEYFRFAEEIGAEPLPVVSCGIACQFENEPHWHSDATLDELQPFVDDALDLIEFANGPVDSEWGRVRAEMGHPEPFNMKYIGIGNEQWGEGYPQRLAVFVKAIRAEYPEIGIIGSSGPYKDGPDFEFLWKEMRALGVDLVDEHYYANEQFFTENAARYDSYPRTGPKVFAGEYACHGVDGRKWNHFNASLLEAAFMTGLERNADVVHMASYAPLLAHVEGWQWRPDMIWFDNLDVMRSCSYYVQQMYATNCGTHSLPALMNGEIVAGQSGDGFGEGLYASAVRDEVNRKYIVKVVNLAHEAKEITLKFDGLRRKETLNSTVKCTTLHSDDPHAENTLKAPQTIVPVASILDASLWNKNAITTVIGSRTFAVYTLRY